MGGTGKWGRIGAKLILLEPRLPEIENRWDFQWGVCWFCCFFQFGLFLWVFFTFVHDIKSGMLIVKISLWPAASPRQLSWNLLPMFSPRHSG